MSLSFLGGLIADDTEDSKTLTDSFYPPTLTGQNATDFDDKMTSAKSNSTKILLDPFFSGITPVTLTLPIGSTLIGWVTDMASEARTIVDSASPTPAEKQTAADNYKTIEKKADLAISTYT